MASSKNDCKDCDVCRLHEIGIIQSECEPRCYLEQPKQEAFENSFNRATTSTVAFECDEKQSNKHVVRR